MDNLNIPFNRPSIVGNELDYIKQAVRDGKISGDGIFSKKCSELMEQKYKIKKVLLTTSCSTALDMASILINIKDGDEVILPSYTFVSTANSFYMRGAKLRFIDIRKDTLNIDESKIEEAITPQTRAIIAVHYGGVSCEMDKILNIAKKYNLYVIEDAAQGIESKYKGNYLGAMGDIGCLSFHETKNITCGEGGAILINNKKFFERAEIIREKGTNRSKFFRGEVDKYTWVDVGSSYLPSEILSAFLYAQLENIGIVINSRKELWKYYYDNLEELEIEGFVRRPIVPQVCSHNGHLFYIIVGSEAVRNLLLEYLKSRGILAIFHYPPLHLSPMGRRMGYRQGQLPVTEKISSRLVRLPLFFGLTRSEQDTVIKNLKGFFKSKNNGY
ncbi:MAG: dTDP-4-amino-4,6-dideoxygalactose transaminase [Actinomycetota bacterium]|nr:dTDP-4-amino-4,6-dideoxygalactose transaminase [Actinomycetota bacterium]